MKSLLVLFLFLFTANPAIYQKQLNNVDINSIHVINSYNKTYSLGPANDLQKAFGKATVKKERNDELGGYNYIYNYNGFITYFNERDWEATTITGGKYIAVLNGNEYKIGDNISKLKSRFPLSYQNRDKYDKFICIMISHKKSIYDAEVNISYDNGGYITKISIAIDNS
ncbi:hypothetical protein [Mucilaginibacter sp. dw_454]|uniref:hypothetical protein n=1 Tax=Mucilaginibacter sp. dw_454 TaxID=2720079 RepID=UPI001BD2E5DA|nr:hypothetical protein [Mucilaginibacter sp. dw_454]